MMFFEDTIDYFHIPDWHITDGTRTPQRFLSVDG